MAQQSKCGFVMGFLLLATAVFALLFGTDEPAMQTDNAAIVVTGMIFFGIVLMASNQPKKPVVIAPTPQLTIQRRQNLMQARTGIANPQPSPTMTSSTMTHGSFPEREIITKVLVICPYCGFKNEQGVLKCQNCSAEI